MKLSSGCILEIQLPMNLGFSYVLYLDVDDLLNKKCVDHLIIPFNYLSTHTCSKLEFNPFNNELTAPLLSFRPRVRGEKGWKIIDKIDFKSIFIGFDFKICIQYDSSYYGKEDELKWFLVRDFDLDYKTIIRIQENMHLENYEIFDQELLSYRILFELDLIYDLKIDYDEILKDTWVMQIYKLFKARPSYRNTPKELWGKANL